MKFMMLMIPDVYYGNKKLDGFKPDPKQMEAMGRFKELARLVKTDFRVL